MQIVEDLREEESGAGSASGFVGGAREIVQCGCEPGRKIRRKRRARIFASGKVTQRPTNPRTYVTSGLFRNDVEVTPPEELLQNSHAIRNQGPMETGRARFRK